MTTRLVVATGSPKRSILQQNFRFENGKENQENAPQQRRGVIYVAPKQEPLDDEEIWKDSPKRGYVTNTEGGPMRRRHKVVQAALTNGAPSHVIARRNERERNRVRQVNDSFSILRSRIPEYLYGTEVDDKGKQTRRKLSKVETLRLAVDYIQQLESLLNIKTDLCTDDSEEDGFFSAPETTQGSFFPTESEAEMSQISPDESSSDVSSPTFFSHPTQNVFLPRTVKDKVLLTDKVLEVDHSDADSSAGSPLPPLCESFPTKVSYSDLYVPYGLVDLSVKPE